MIYPDFRYWSWVLTFFGGSIAWKVLFCWGFRQRSPQKRV
jgi:hypothetical protein